MGKLGLLTLLLVIAYFSYGLYSIYSDTQPPVAYEHDVNGSSGAGLEGEKKLVSTNIFPASLKLTYHFFLSNWQTLPPLDTLLKQKELRRVFVYLGSISNRPYSWEGEAELASARAERQTFSERLKAALDLSGKGDVSVQELVPPFMLTNHTIYFHVRTEDAVTGKETLLQTVEKISATLVPGHLSRLKRFLLKDPWGDKLRAATQHLQTPLPPVESIPEYLQVGPVLEHRPLLTEKLLFKFGADSPLLDINKQKFYFPIHVNSFISPQDEYLPLVSLPHEEFVLEKSEQLKSAALTPIKISYKPVGFGTWLFYLHMNNALASLENMHFSQYDVNSMRMMMGSSSPWILLLVYIISVTHLIFEALAVYSDVTFWKSQKQLAQHFSANGLVMDMILEVITVLYLRDNGDTFIVQFFVLLRLLLNIWKLRKIVTFSMSRSFPYFFKVRQNSSPAACAVEAMNRTEKDEAGAATPSVQNSSLAVKEADHEKKAPPSLEELQRFENQCMWYLFLLLLPMVVAVSAYELIYVPQKGWWSWLVTSLATCGYTFGFVSMTPQLFRNYKLQSVAHMPWRVLCYQFTNAFIDDIFSCFIRMPRMHRMSVFRDDVVFIIFMAQRFMYRHEKPLLEDEIELPHKPAAAVAASSADSDALPEAATSAVGPSSPQKLQMTRRKKVT